MGMGPRLVAANYSCYTLNGAECRNLSLLVGTGGGFVLPAIHPLLSSYITAGDEVSLLSTKTGPYRRLKRMKSSSLMP